MVQKSNGMVQKSNGMVQKSNGMVQKNNVWLLSGITSTVIIKTKVLHHLS